MDRKGQLRNVAFGGAWSEQIDGQEALSRALDVLDAAGEECLERDLTDDAVVSDALALVSRTHLKGADLAVSYRKALVARLPGDRVQEVRRIAQLFRIGVAARLGR